MCILSGLENGWRQVDNGSDNKNECSLKWRDETWRTHRKQLNGIKCWCEWNKKMSMSKLGQIIMKSTWQFCELLWWWSSSFNFSIRNCSKFSHSVSTTNDLDNNPLIKILKIKIAVGKNGFTFHFVFFFFA